MPTHTGAVYNDKKLSSSGLVGEAIESGAVIAMKTHNLPRTLAQKSEVSYVLHQFMVEIVHITVDTID